MAASLRPCQACQRAMPRIHLGATSPAFSTKAPRRIRHLTPRTHRAAHHPRSFRTHRRLQQDPAPTPAPPLAPPPLPARRSLRPYIYSTLFLLLGLGAGQFFTAIVIPPPLPVPDTEDDLLTTSKIRRDIDALPIVRQLRADRDAWLEYEAYMTKPPAERAESMTAGVMAGSRGIGVQRVFWHRTEQRLIGVVFIGGALSGWPGVTHGGCVATLLQESLDTVANGPEVLRGAEGGWGRAGRDVAALDVNYRKPTTANMLYLVRAEVDDTGLERDGRFAAKATIENALTGVITAEATGTCSSGLVQRVEEEVVATGNTLGKWLGF